MTIQIKKAGTYVAPAAILVKKAGVYAAVAGAFVKVSGTYQPTFVVNSVPTVVSAPSITGTPTYGVPTTATDAVFNGTPTPVLTYQWNIGGVPIGSPIMTGSRAAAYPTLLASDIGKTLTRTDTATNSQGSASSTSAGVVVANAWIKKASVVSISQTELLNYSQPIRVAHTDSARTSMILRNFNTDAAQFGVVTITNDHYDTTPGTWVDIPSNTESVLTSSSQQVWMRSKLLFTAATATNTTGNTIRITSAAPHGRADQSTIATEGGSPSTYNVTSAVITVIDANTFDFQAASAPGTCTTLPRVKPTYPITIEIETTVSQ
jgi:hypothetical protein